MSTKMGYKKKKTNKKLSSIAPKVYRKDSFDRFGDDLCQLLLSYHSISDKLRFECICKQWQRLVFERQKKLIISEYSKRVIDSEAKRKLREYEGFDGFGDEIKIQNYIWFSDKRNIFRLLCQKFKFITDLRIKYFKLDNNLIDILIENCNRLKSIDINVYEDIKVEKYERFSEKFGQSLKWMRIFGIKDKDLEIVLKMCYNLETIKLFNTLDVMSGHLSQRLQEIDCKIESNFQSFADQYKNQIRRLRFDVFIFSDAMPNIRRSLLVSQFTNLEELYLRLSRTEHFSANCLDGIANQCKRLRLLSLNMCSLTFERQLFKVLAQFQCLQDLEISSYEYVSDFNENNCENRKEFKICSKIKYFSLNTILINDNDLNLIFICFPNLRRFSLNCRYDGLNITDKSLDNLSKLQNLATLSMRTHKYFPFITDSYVEKFIRNCKTIRNISIRYNLDSIETIEPLIQRANEKPKNLYKFDFYVKSLKVYLENRNQISVPKNLKLFAFHSTNKINFICSADQIWHLDNVFDQNQYII